VNRSNAAYITSLACFLLCIAYSLVLSNEVATGTNLKNIGSRVIAQYTLASALMLFIWQSSAAKVNEGVSISTSLLLVGVLARFILFFAEPYTSNDVTRYLFDGRLVVEGYDPYRTPHNAPELAALRHQWAPPSEHLQYVTLYPPLALGLFSAAASFGVEAALWAWKTFIMLTSLGVLLLGYRVLQHAGKLQHFPLIALSPLLILEAGEGLHLDIVTALTILMAVYFWQSKRLVLVGGCIALGGLLKILPMVLLLPLFIVLTRWQERLVLVLSAVCIWVSGYLISFASGLRPIGSIAVFFEKWRSGSALFLWVEPYVPAMGMLVIVMSIALLGFAMIALYLWVEKREQAISQTGRLDSSLFFGMQLAMALPLMVTPVIFPWYLLPIMVLLALRPNLLVILWSLTIPLLYQVLNQFLCCGDWAPAEWPTHLIGICLIASAAIALLSMVRKP